MGWARFIPLYIGVSVAVGGVAWLALTIPAPTWVCAMIAVFGSNLCVWGAWWWLDRCDRRHVGRP